MHTIRIAASEDTSVNLVCFAPDDTSTILVLGKGFIRLYRLTDGQVRPLTINLRRDQATFSSYAWAWDGKLIVGTHAGDILLLEDYELQVVIYPAHADDPIVPVVSLASYSKGFVAGGAHGDLRVFERAEDLKEQYSLCKVVQFEDKTAGVVAMVVSHSEETVVCATSTQQLYQASLANADSFKEDSLGYDHVIAHFHAPGAGKDASINDIDVCLWKPLIVGTRACMRACTHASTPRLSTSSTTHVHGVSVRYLLVSGQLRQGSLREGVEHR
jgi:WD40 repeat protein